MIIEIHNPEVEAKIKAQAQARGVSVEDLIAAIIESLNGIQAGSIEDTHYASSDDEFIAAMESIATDVPPLPRDFSREDIYFPRD